MNKWLIIYCVLGALFFISPKVFAKQIDRILETEVDLSKPYIIYMTPGRSTLVELPCDISHTILGLTGDVKVTIGPDSLKNMSLWLSEDGSQATNVTVKCDDEVFVFDIYPNKYNHQDYINVTHYFDGRRSQNRKLVSSSSFTTKPKAQLKKLLASSETQKKQHMAPDPWSEKVLKKLNSEPAKKRLIMTGEK